MATAHVDRRLVAILAADMVGYSRLMEADETGTIARQKAHRAELVDPEIATHGGLSLCNTRLRKSRESFLSGLTKSAIVSSTACAKPACRRGSFPNGNASFGRYISFF